MPDTMKFDDDLQLEDDVARRIGAKILEMADRVEDVDAAVAGAQAIWHFEIDQKRYRVVVTVA